MTSHPRITKPIVLITGANQGIGFAASRALASEPYHYHILLGSRNPDNGAAAAQKLQSEGLAVEPVTIDISSDESIQAAADEVKSKYGRIDILINNAGICIYEEHSELLKLREQWRKTFETNVFGSLAVTEAFVPLLEASDLYWASQTESSANTLAKKPTILYISSSLGSLSNRADPNDRWSTAPVAMDSYRASKAALNMVALNFAARFRERGWRVNTCCPGSVSTRINDFKAGLGVERSLPVIVGLVTGQGIKGKEVGTAEFWDENGKVKW